MPFLLRLHSALLAFVLGVAVLPAAGQATPSPSWFDLDGNLVVDVHDLFQLADVWQAPAGAPAWSTDGQWDGTDLLLFIQHWHATVPATATPTPTPTCGGPPFTPAPDDYLVVDLPGGVTLELVLLPAGNYCMGSDDTGDWVDVAGSEQPVHWVTFADPFYLQTTELTQRQWDAVMKTNPAAGATHGVGDNYPVYYVNWADAQNFVSGLNALGKGTFRLPSEAEWEYACRAGTAGRYSFGISGCAPQDCTQTCALSAFGWWCGNRTDQTAPVGRKPANPWGLYDMHGNVWEWCQDAWFDDYAGAPTDGSAREGLIVQERVIRGGSLASDAGSCRSGNRFKTFASFQAYNVGLRIVREP